MCLHVLYVRFSIHCAYIVLIYMYCMYASVYSVRYIVFTCMFTRKKTARNLYSSLKRCACLISCFRPLGPKHRSCGTFCDAFCDPFCDPFCVPFCDPHFWRAFSYNFRPQNRPKLLERTDGEVRIVLEWLFLHFGRRNFCNQSNCELCFKVHAGAHGIR